jgi:hypothetical protein
MLSLFLKRFFTLAIVATAFLGIFAYGQGRRGKCNRGWLSKKLSSGDKVIIDFEKTLLGQSHKYDPRNGCDGILLEDHAFHMGNRFTVELDCFQKLLKLGAHRGSTKDWSRKRRTIRKVKEVYQTEEKFEDDDVCRPDSNSKGTMKHSAENERDKYKHCSHKKCKVGTRVQVTRTPQKIKEYRDLIGCTGTLEKVKRAKGSNMLFDFVKKHMHVGFCSFKVDDDANNLANEKCKDVEGLEPMLCSDFVPLRNGRKRAEYISDCRGGKFCDVSTRVQLINNLHYSKDVEYWKNCFGTIHKIGKTMITGTKEFKVKLDCTEEMIKEGNRCCWPGGEMEGPHVTGYLSKHQFHVK